MLIAVHWGFGTTKAQMTWRYGGSKKPFRVHLTAPSTVSLHVISEERTFNQIYRCLGTVGQDCKSMSFPGILAVTGKLQSFYLYYNVSSL